VRTTDELPLVGGIAPQSRDRWSRFATSGDARHIDATTDRGFMPLWENFQKIPSRVIDIDSELLYKGRIVMWEAGAWWLPAFL
jgi:hypothetical protein